MPSPSWIDGYNMARSSFATANGVTTNGAPRLTNEQAASVLRATMDNAQRNKLDVGVTEHWYPLALVLSGWRQPGDRFLVDAEHRGTMFPDQYTPELWTLALNVATTLQNRGVAFRAPTVNPQIDYTAVLKQAWSKMQRDAKATAQPLPRSPMPLPAATPPTEEKSNILPLLLLLAIGMRKGR